MLFNYTQPEEKIKAAAYVRMSTEHQKYSPENQMAAIKEYADKHNYEIIKTYSDGGKSGLNISGRASLQQMLADVQGRQQQYKVILVLDVTRWGRFQDADESAYLEFMCKKAGVRVQYCAEQFTNDDSPVSTIIKSVKRTMAAEYSRELSGKVFAGQSRLITLGYKQGGPAGYGLRRMLIDEYGNHKGVLARGEHKSIATDRVILVPGPEEEQENVRWMYKRFPDKKIVVVTHHAPSTKSVSDIYLTDKTTPAFANNLEQFILDYPNIKLWCHGHIHSASDYRIGNCRIICNPRGYVKLGEHSGFIDNLIIEL